MNHDLFQNDYLKINNHTIYGNVIKYNIKWV